LAPIAKTFAKTALRTGGHVIGDVLSGKDSLKSSAKKRISQAVVDQLTTKKPKRRRRNKSTKDIFDSL
jgi:hypothetical protein